mmetsp:Transcript_2888/g.4382  ORF Transcript_2888/g.4382 Transcript_2888/m.4382 type:complete len:151 (-) Transcript_2888:46-498(-)
MQPTNAQSFCFADQAKSTKNARSKFRTKLSFLSFTRTRNPKQQGSSQNNLHDIHTDSTPALSQLGNKSQRDRACSVSSAYSLTSSTQCKRAQEEYMEEYITSRNKSCALFSTGSIFVNGKSSKKAASERPTKQHGRGMYCLSVPLPRELL